MDAIQKLNLMAPYLRVEPAEDHQGAPPAGSPNPQAACPGYRPAPAASSQGACGPADKDSFPIHQAVLPNGKRIALLKTLLTSACERDCFYCAFRAGRDFRRATFKPEELAQAFLNLYKARTAEGLFLSSGVAGGGVRTQDRLIATAEVLRLKLGFKGYLHLKIMPGAERAQVERAMQLADRVSINLEAPNDRRLSDLAPHKVFMEELLRPLQWVQEIRRSQPGIRGWNGHWPSTVTQFVVGGVGETDLELLSTTARLYQQVHIARAYFSGFSPVSDTPLENVPAANPWREHRLYQASFLLRDYGFELEELPFSSAGDLPLQVDPKQAWAEANLQEAPIELNRADRHELLRVPGIGPKGAIAILEARRKSRLRSLADLRSAGIASTARLAPYVLLDGQRPVRQLRLF